MPLNLTEEQILQLAFYDSPQKTEKVLANMKITTGGIWGRTFWGYIASLGVPTFACMTYKFAAGLLKWIRNVGQKNDSSIKMFFSYEPAEQNIK